MAKQISAHTSFTIAAAFKVLHDLTIWKAKMDATYQIDHVDGDMEFLGGQSAIFPGNGFAQLLAIGRHAQTVIGRAAANGNGEIAALARRTQSSIARVDRRARRVLEVV
jgi:hypothetical protein